MHGEPNEAKVSPHEQGTSPNIKGAFFDLFNALPEEVLQKNGNIGRLAKSRSLVDVSGWRIMPSTLLGDEYILQRLRNIPGEKIQAVVDAARKAAEEDYGEGTIHQEHKRGALKLIEMLEDAATAPPSETK